MKVLNDLFCLVGADLCFAQSLSNKVIIGIWNMSIFRFWFLGIRVIKLKNQKIIGIWNVSIFRFSIFGFWEIDL